MKENREESSADLTRREFVYGVGTFGLGVVGVQREAAAPDRPRAATAVAGSFLVAKPVWPRGKETEKNLSVGFRAAFNGSPRRKLALRVTASTVYRAFLNGKFCGYGPARAAHGHYRVDEWDLTDQVRPGANVVAVEVAGYNVNSYYLLDQPSFLQAELVADSEVLAATGSSTNPFAASVLTERVQKVQRYSFQRPFSEVYRLKPGFDAWRTNAAAEQRTEDCQVVAAKKTLSRGVPYPRFDLRQPVWVVGQGRVETGFKPEKVFKDYSLTNIDSKLNGFPETELEVIPSIELQTVKSIPGNDKKRLYNPTEKISLGERSYAILDFGTNLTGFLGAKLTCRERTRFFFTFDEILSDGDVDFKRLHCVNIVHCEMPAGVFDIEAFEPYTLRYLKLMVLAGECEVEGIYLREYANPNVETARFAASDERLNRLFAAGRETYRQNALDLFMDCPSRERGGWLCDSYFTARVAALLSGDTAEERNFIENFALPESFSYLPKGMLPMCYPADHYNGNFIPNWAMWFVIQLEAYLKRSGDRQLVEALRPKMLDLFEYFRPFKNADGLLEKLQGWVFVEWSAAGDFVQDVNYPTNMLYAAALDSASRMYGLPELQREAEKIRGVIRQQSFDGQFFVDNAVRKDGKLQVTRNRTEVCQYFAFYFGIATPSTHPELWRTLREHFGPQRKQTKSFPEVHEANSFVGNMLRVEILSAEGLGQQILDESISYLLYMAERTGTLWENVEASASCNHGFASHIVTTLYRDVLGLYEVDAVNRVLRLRFPDVKLDWCEGQVPVAGGFVKLTWRTDGKTKIYRLDAPAGYSVDLINSSEEWVRE